MVGAPSLARALQTFAWRRHRVSAWPAKPSTLLPGPGSVFDARVLGQLAFAARAEAGLVSPPAQARFDLRGYATAGSVRTLTSAGFPGFECALQRRPQVVRALPPARRGRPGPRPRGRSAGRAGGRPRPSSRRGTPSGASRGPRCRCCPSRRPRGSRGGPSCRTRGPRSRRRRRRGAGRPAGPGAPAWPPSRSRGPSRGSRTAPGPSSSRARRSRSRGPRRRRSRRRRRRRSRRGRAPARARRTRASGEAARARR